MESKRLLIVEDDAVIQQVLRNVLERAGFQTTIVSDAPDALKVIQQQGLPHLAIVDLHLPTMHGFTLAEKIKRMGDVPIIILTAEKSEDVVVQGIEEYADDYITKPFNNREIVARIQRVLSRITDYSYAEAPVIQVDEHLSVDFANNRVLVDGTEESLTPTETNLLSILMRNKGRYVSAEILIARVWPNKEVYEETLRVHMSRLRRKLQPEDDPNRPQYIRTERGAGYAFFSPNDEGINLMAGRGLQSISK